MPLTYLYSYLKTFPDSIEYFSMIFDSFLLRHSAVWFGKRNCIRKWSTLWFSVFMFFFFYHEILNPRSTRESQSLLQDEQKRKQIWILQKKGKHICCLWREVSAQWKQISMKVYWELMRASILVTVNLISLRIRRRESGEHTPLASLTEFSLCVY